MLNRLKNQLQSIEYYFEQQPDPNIVCLRPMTSKGTLNYNHWQFVFKAPEGKGKMGGGYYRAQFFIPNQYPNVPPEVFFDKNIKHMHIYVSGKLCMDILNPRLGKWSITFGIWDIAKRIIQVLCLMEPDAGDDANSQMVTIWKTSPANYYKQMSEQAKQYSNRYKQYLKKQ